MIERIGSSWILDKYDRIEMHLVLVIGEVA
jgi:hypothetical protein